MDFQAWLEQFSPGSYWLFILFSSFIENVFPPYPGDIITVLGGYLVGTGKLSLVVMVSSVFSGSILGALVMYFFGKKVIFFLSSVLKMKIFAKGIEDENFKKAEAWFVRNGFATVVFSRFSAGIRFFVSIIAGLTQMNLLLFITAFSIATIIWNSLLIWGGYSLGDNWSKIVYYMRLYNTIVIGIIVTAILAFLVVRRRKK